MKIIFDIGMMFSLKWLNTLNPHPEENTIVDEMDRVNSNEYLNENYFYYLMHLRDYMYHGEIKNLTNGTSRAFDMIRED